MQNTVNATYGAIKKGKTMTALEYMEKQVRKHRQNFLQQYDRNAPDEVLANIRAKIRFYEEAAEALKNDEKRENARKYDEC